MKTKMKMKIVIDILMTIVLFVLMSYQYTGGDNHEIAGAFMLVLFILHNILNIKWYQNLVKGKYTGARILQTVVDSSLLIIMLLQMTNGISMSNNVFTFIELGIKASTARMLHMVFAYVVFLLMGFHIGLHYGMIMNMFGKIFGLKNKHKAGIIVLRCVAAVIAGYGIYALEKRDFISNILQENKFAFFDYEEPIIYFIADYIAVMGLMIFIAYYLQKLVVKLASKKQRKKTTIWNVSSVKRIVLRIWKSDSILNK